MADLIQRLSEKEQEQLAAELKASARVKEAKRQVSAAAAENTTLRLAHAQELKVLKARHEKALRDKSFEWRASVQKAVREQALAEGDLCRAEQRLRKSREHCYSLTCKIQDLQAHLEERTDGVNMSLEELEESLNERINRVTLQGQRRIESMRGHARENSLVLGAKLEAITEQMQAQMHRHHVQAEGQVRLKELCKLASVRGDYTMSDDTYRKVKGDLVGLWQLQKAPTRSPSPRIDP